MKRADRWRQARSIVIGLTWVGMFAACAQPIATNAPDPSRATGSRPNIVIVLADDMGYSDIGAFGGEIPTPNIDRLAADGVQFTEFYNTGRCWPTRAALMAGRHQHAVGLGGDLQYRDDKGAVHPSPERTGPYQGYYRFDAPMLAERLQRAGYATYAIGKWHLGDVDIESWPTRRGFDRYFGPVTGTDSYFDSQTDPARVRRYVDGETPWPVPREGFYATTAFTDRAVEDIVRAARDPDRPFFLYLAYTAPHWPLQALPEDVARQSGRYRDGWDAARAQRFHAQRLSGLHRNPHVLPPRPADIPVWQDVKEPARSTALMEVYAAQMSALDRGVGRVVEALRESGELDDTIILFLSDNGGELEDLADRKSTARFHDPSAPPGSARRFESYTRRWAYVSNTPYRGYKTQMWEGGIKTPLIVHWPHGVHEPGRTQRQVGHVIDLAPTLLEAAGAGGPRPDWSDGESLLDAIAAPTPEHARRLYFEHIGNRAIRDGDWKAVKDVDGRWHLFDLTRDPTESVDLAQSEPQRLQTLVAAWTQWARKVGVEGYGSGDEWPQTR